MRPSCKTPLPSMVFSSFLCVLCIEGFALTPEKH